MCDNKNNEKRPDPKIEIFTKTLPENLNIRVQQENRRTISNSQTRDSEQTDNE